MASFVNEELADNLAALGRITRARLQGWLGDGGCGGLDARLEVEIKFGNKEMTMSLLILSGVLYPFVLEWNYFTRFETEIKWTRDHYTSQELTQ